MSEKSLVFEIAEDDWHGPVSVLGVTVDLDFAGFIQRFHALDPDKELSQKELWPKVCDLIVYEVGCPRPSIGLAMRFINLISAKVTELKKKHGIGSETDSSSDTSSLEPETH